MEQVFKGKLQEEELMISSAGGLFRLLRSGNGREEAGMEKMLRMQEEIKTEAMILE